MKNLHRSFTSTMGQFEHVISLAPQRVVLVEAITVKVTTIPDRVLNGTEWDITIIDLEQGDGGEGAGQVGQGSGASTDDDGKVTIDVDDWCYGKLLVQFSAGAECRADIDVMYRVPDQISRSITASDLTKTFELPIADLSLFQGIAVRQADPDSGPVDVDFYSSVDPIHGAGWLIDGDILADPGTVWGWYWDHIRPGTTFEFSTDSSDTAVVTFFWE